ncbi:hypothetical protein [Ideonella sp. A 288]|uniref:hypothetical protein n=1 Tax=Ideonella sp. A 288 TaxID=1962181 RepID=UPI000B4A745F|nr:hypothetical protein [Ideonella sp. A 288]
MLRRWIALVLLLLQLQPALAFMPDRVSALAAEIDHGAIHQAGQAHHHDDGLGVQLDDDDAAATLHVHHDGGHHSALLPPVAVTGVAMGAPDARAAFVRGVLPDPHLEGPLRPPRQRQ